MITLASNANTMRSETRNIQSHPIDVNNESQDVQASAIADLTAVIQDLTLFMDSHVEDCASKSAKFFGITLRGNLDSNRWVTENLDDNSLGVIMDVHLVFEHIFHQAYAGEGLLKTLQGQYKVQIDTINQVLACSSFDTRIPKFLKHHKASDTSCLAVKTTSSNKRALDCIPS
jgi:hypothetical protein